MLTANIFTIGNYPRLRLQNSQISSIKSFHEGMPTAQPSADRVIRAGFFTTNQLGKGQVWVSLAYDIVKAQVRPLL